MQSKAKLFFPAHVNNKLLNVRKEPKKYQVRWAKFNNWKNNLIQYVA